MTRLAWSTLALGIALAGCSSQPAPAPPEPQPAEPAPDAETQAAGSEDPPALFACHEARGTIRATFAPGTTLRDLVVWASAYTCKNIVYRHEAGCARVDVVAPREMTPEESWALFVSSVETLGLEVEERDDNVALIGLPEGGACEPPASAGTGDVDDDAAEPKIVEKSETSFEIDRAVLERITSNPGAIDGARVVPSIKDGAPNGFKVYAIRPGSLYARLGLRNGDTVHAVNGHPLTDPGAALETYTEVEHATRLELSVTRLGKPITLEYTIR